MRMAAALVLIGLASASYAQESAPPPAHAPLVEQKPALVPTDVGLLRPDVADAIKSASIKHSFSAPFKLAAIGWTGLTVVTLLNSERDGFGPVVLPLVNAVGTLAIGILLDVWADADIATVTDQDAFLKREKARREEERRRRAEQPPSINDYP